MKLPKIKLDWFLSGMVIAIVLAALLPAPGAQGGILHPELLTKAGIALVFFLNGALLSFAALKDGIPALAPAPDHPGRHLRAVPADRHDFFGHSRQVDQPRPAPRPVLSLRHSVDGFVVGGDDGGGQGATCRWPFSTPPCRA
ncbi:MAG: bile acid:sodium symporter [Asticcacaulis sp.]